MRVMSVALAVPVLAFVACSCETLEASFSSMSTAEAQDMVSRGWIPEILPRTATDVRVRWDIENNKVRGRARVSEYDLEGLRVLLRPLDGSVVPSFRVGRWVTPRWWPAELREPGTVSELRGPGTVGELARMGWEVFEIPDHAESYIAVHRSEGCVYFWDEGV